MIGMPTTWVLVQHIGPSSRLMTIGRANGTGRVDACERPRRLLVTSKEKDEPDENVTEATLSAHGSQSILVLSQRGLRLDWLAAYGAGLQIHVEDLAAHIAGRERAAQTRWDELLPAYQELAANIG